MAFSWARLAFAFDIASFTLKTLRKLKPLTWNEVFQDHSLRWEN